MAFEFHPDPFCPIQVSCSDELQRLSPCIIFIKKITNYHIYQNSPIDNTLIKKRFLLATQLTFDLTHICSIALRLSILEYALSPIIGLGATA